MPKLPLSDAALDEYLLRLLSGDEKISSSEFKITPESAHVIEAKGPIAWVLAFFGPGTTTDLSAGFAPHHHKFWNWIWSIESGVYTPPFIWLLARGGAKSSSMEMGYAAMGARKTRNFMLNVSETEPQAQEHLGNIQTLLETPEILAGYPDLGARLVNQYGSSRGWSNTQLVTKHGVYYMCLSLEKAARGVKKSGYRPDFEGFDDVDGEDDSPHATKKKKNKITKKILAAGATHMTGMFCQNVITNTSLASQFANGEFPFFTDGEIEGPIPACRNLDVDLNPDYVPGKAGSKKWIVKYCEPTWEGQNQAIIEWQINQWTLPVFLSESQHLVSQVDEGAILPEWDEVVNVLEEHEVLRAFPEFQVYDETLQKMVFRVPRHCPRVMGGDEGCTFDHPSVFGWYFSAPEPKWNQRDLRGWFFRYREYYTPIRGIDSERVSYLQVGKKILEFEADAKETGLIKRRILSSDAKGMRDLFYEELKIATETPNSTYTSGIPEMKAYMASYKDPQGNPFVRYPQGYIDPKTGEDKSGKPYEFSTRFSLIVPDGAARLIVGPTGQLQRTGPRPYPIGVHDQERFRWEAPHWVWEETTQGEQKKKPHAFSEDAMSECRYVFGSGSAPQPAKLKGEESVLKNVLTHNKHLTTEAINANVDADEREALKLERRMALDGERELQRTRSNLMIPTRLKIRRKR